MINTLLIAAELAAPELAETSKGFSELFNSPELHFQSGLLVLGLLILVSTICDKLGFKLGIPGSIFLFIIGLSIHITGFSFESIPLEQVHTIALCVLLFFSGLSFDQVVLRKTNLLFSSLRLAIFGTAMSMFFWLFYVRFGLGVFNRIGYLDDTEPKMLALMTVVIVYSTAVHDWNAFYFVARRVKMFKVVLMNVFKVETSVSAAISVAVAELLVVLWIRLNPEYTMINYNALIPEIFNGFLVGIVSGCILGYLLNLVIRYFVTSKPQLVLVAVAFTILGFVVSDLTLSHGGFLCSLVMGIVTSLSYRSSSTDFGESH